MADQMLMAGAAKVDITPKGNVWMDGMPRSHASEGVHDPLFARALVASNAEDKKSKIALVSCDVCAFDTPLIGEIRKAASEKTGIPVENMVIAATHTHSGPAVHGFFNPKAEEYEAKEFAPKVIQAICQANDALAPAAIGCGTGVEDTISYYRRLWTKDGQIIMNWIEYPAEDIVGPAEEGDSEVGVVKVVSADHPNSVIAIVYDHPGHPNVMSGENFQISGDYPGLSSKIIEDKFGGVAMFVNGAHGSVDIDGLKDRDWEGVDRTGNALGNAVINAVAKITLQKDVKIAVSQRQFTVPVRTMTEKELAWAKNIMKNASGEIETLADGVGDEWTANLFLELDKKKGQILELELVGIALGDMAFISFPGELFNEIGKKIRKQCPFKYTYSIDCANDYVGYFPTKKAIGEGGYAVLTRNCDDTAETTIIENSLDILKELAK